MAQGWFVISLDFELMWGVHDHKTIKSYGKNVLGVREAIPAMLKSFKIHSCRATWATVGFLFCKSKEELRGFSPKLKPQYQNSKLSNYSYFDEVGSNETVDPYHYGASLIEEIAQYEGQEIASHSFSHYYCLAAGQDTLQFEADTAAAVAVADYRGHTLRSFVFPRNQFSRPHLDALRKHNIQVYRGNEVSWLYDPSDAGKIAQLAKRGGRLFDAYVDLSGSNSWQNSTMDGVKSIPSSRFLRPYSNRWSSLEFARVRRVVNAMTQAAKDGAGFHLWWHPHNFGTNLEANIGTLNVILSHFVELRDTYGMRSANMGDFA